MGGGETHSRPLLLLRKGYTSSRLDHQLTCSRPFVGLGQLESTREAPFGGGRPLQLEEGYALSCWHRGVRWSHERSCLESGSCLFPLQAEAQRITKDLKRSGCPT